MKRIILGLLALVFTCGTLTAIAKVHRKEGTMPMPQMFPMSSVNGVLRSLSGTFVGKGTMKDMQLNKPMNYVEHLTTTPALDNKFVMTQTTSEPDANGQVFQGKGFMGYDAINNRYTMYWFDTMGFGGEFVGRKQGNTLFFTHPEGRTGRAMTLTFTLVSPNEYRMVLKEGRSGGAMATLVNTTYTRTTAITPGMEDPTTQPRGNY